MATLKIPVSGSDHRQGATHPKVTLVEFGDYECPYCGEAYWVMKGLHSQYSEQLEIVFRHFPLTSVHTHALQAAITVEFAGSHGVFWQAHNALYENQRRLSWTLFEEIIVELNLSPADLKRAMEERTYNGRIQADFNGGVRSGVNGTPSFFFNGIRYDGSPDEASMSDAIDFLLNQKM